MSHTITLCTFAEGGSYGHRIAANRRSEEMTIDPAAGDRPASRTCVPVATSQVTIFSPCPSMTCLSSVEKNRPFQREESSRSRRQLSCLTVEPSTTLHSQTVKARIPTWSTGHWAVATSRLPCENASQRSLFSASLASETLTPHARSQTLFHLLPTFPLAKMLLGHGVSWQHSAHAPDLSLHGPMPFPIFEFKVTAYVYS